MDAERKTQNHKRISLEEESFTTAMKNLTLRNVTKLICGCLQVVIIKLSH